MSFVQLLLLYKKPVFSNHTIQGIEKTETNRRGLTITLNQSRIEMNLPKFQHMDEVSSEKQHQLLGIKCNWSL